MPDYVSIIADVRIISDGTFASVQVMRAVPVVDASGAITGFEVDDWESVETFSDPDALSR